MKHPQGWHRPSYDLRSGERIDDSFGVVGMARTIRYPANEPYPERMFISLPSELPSPRHMIEIPIWPKGRL